VIVKLDPIGERSQSRLEKPKKPEKGRKYPKRGGDGRRIGGEMKKAQF
jgi:hypothetical protein